VKIRGQKKKRAERRAFIATRGVLTIQEGLDRSQVTNIVPESKAVTEEVIVKTRTPRTYSICKSLLHTTHTCPTKQVSN
jgi:hypothetical protein